MENKCKNCYTQTQNLNPKPKNIYTQTQDPNPKTFWVQTSGFKFQKSASKFFYVKNKMWINKIWYQLKKKNTDFEWAFASSARRSWGGMSQTYSGHCLF